MIDLGDVNVECLVPGKTSFVCRVMVWSPTPRTSRRKATLVTSAALTERSSSVESVDTRRHQQAGSPQIHSVRDAVSFILLPFFLFSLLDHHFVSSSSSLGPPTSSLVFQKAKRQDLEDPDLEALFTSVLGEYYHRIPTFQDRLTDRLAQSFEELKKEVASGESVMVVAFSPGALTNKFVALLSAKVDRNNQAVVVMYAAVTSKCRGHKVFHLLAAQLFTELVKAQVVFDQIYFVVDADNEKVLGASINKYHFVETEQEIFESMPRNVGHKTLVCKESSFKKLREVLNRAVPNITSGKAASAAAAAAATSTGTQGQNVAGVLGEGFSLVKAKKAGRPKKDETFRRILEVAQTSGKSVTSLAELAMVVPAFASTLFPSTASASKAGGVEGTAKKVAKTKKKFQVKSWKNVTMKKKRSDSFGSEDNNGTEEEDEEDEEDEEEYEQEQEGSADDDDDNESGNERSEGSPSSPLNPSPSSSTSTVVSSLSSPPTAPGTVAHKHITSEKMRRREETSLSSRDVSSQYTWRRLFGRRLETGPAASIAVLGMPLEMSQPGSRLDWKTGQGVGVGMSLEMCGDVIALSWCQPGSHAKYGLWCALWSHFEGTRDALFFSSFSFRFFVFYFSFLEQLIFFKVLNRIDHMICSDGRP